MNDGSWSHCRFELPPLTAHRRTGFLSPFRTFKTAKVKLADELVWTDPEGHRHTVPAGFESDGASVPAAFQPFAPDFLDILRSGILHDRLCSCPDVPLRYADAIFRQAMVSEGVMPIYALLLYLALRIASPWRKHNQFFWLPFLHNTGF